MTEPLTSSARGGGCLAQSALFFGVAIAAAFAAMMVYVLVVEQWGLIAVRREFSLDMALLYAPLCGMVAGACALAWHARRGVAMQRNWTMTAIALLVALVLFSIFSGLGAFY